MLELGEIEFDFQIAFTFQGIGHGEVQAGGDLAHDFVKVIAVNFYEPTILHLGRRQQGLTTQICHQAHHKGQFLLFYRITDFNVIGNLDTRGAVASYPLLQTV